MTNKGWRRESKRHSLAARGIETSVRNQSIGKPWSMPKNEAESVHWKMQKLYKYEEIGRSAGLDQTTAREFATFMLVEFGNLPVREDNSREWAKMYSVFKSSSPSEAKRLFNGKTLRNLVQSEINGEDLWRDLQKKNSDFEHEAYMKSMSSFKQAQAEEKAKRLKIGDFAHEKKSGYTGEVVGIFKGGKIAFAPDGSPPNFYKLMNKEDLDKDILDMSPRQQKQFSHDINAGVKKVSHAMFEDLQKRRRSR